MLRVTGASHERVAVPVGPDMVDSARTRFADNDAACHLFDTLRTVAQHNHAAIKALETITS